MAIGKKLLIIELFYGSHEKHYKNLESSDTLEETLSTFLQVNENIIIFGDINIDLLNFDHTATPYSLYMIEALDKATRVTEPNTTVFDIIATTCRVNTIYSAVMVV